MDFVHVMQGINICGTCSDVSSLTPDVGNMCGFFFFSSDHSGYVFSGFIDLKEPTFEWGLSVSFLWFHWFLYGLFFFLCLASLLGCPFSCLLRWKLRTLARGSSNTRTWGYTFPLKTAVIPHRSWCNSLVSCHSKYLLIFYLFFSLMPGLSKSGFLPKHLRIFEILFWYWYQL